ncbi:MAG TPA: hypothetical protein VFQ13_17025 [Anaerolineales bacterium]|nr:hypothetical protein [Anaerolineales bacterium]
MKLLFKKTILFALVLALGLASLPLVSVSAAGAYDPPTPGDKQPSTERLEQVWARQLERYERMGQRLEREDEFMARAQKLIDRARENGKDVSAVQAALDAFEAAVQKARPVYESMKGIVNSHQGFDANGKVTDPAKAQETVKSMHAKFQEIKEAMDGTGKALREAIKAFREANPRPNPTSTP